jgi:membrane protein implicated in regulation of membrane protease activity
MLVFVAIAVAAFILVAGSFLFGHDHDHDHGDPGHDVDSGGEPTISIFSLKAIGTLLMGFGAAGAIAMHYGLGPIPASLIGLVCGIALAGLMYLVLGIFYKQQASSLIPTSSAIGCTGTVTVSIGEASPGEVSLCVEGQYSAYSASSSDGRAILKGQLVRVVKTLGSHLVVEKEN